MNVSLKFLFNTVVCCNTNKQTNGGGGGGGGGVLNKALYRKALAQTLKLVVYHFWPKKFLSLV